MRWWLRLAEFDFEVIYKKGTVDQQADALSRLRTKAETIYPDDDDDVLAFLLTDTIEIKSERTQLFDIAYHHLNMM